MFKILFFLACWIMFVLGGSNEYAEPKENLTLLSSPKRQNWNISIQKMLFSRLIRLIQIRQFFRIPSYLPFPINKPSPSALPFLRIIILLFFKLYNFWFLVIFVTFLPSLNFFFCPSMQLSLFCCRSFLFLNIE